MVTERKKTMSTIRKHRKKWQVLIRRKDHPEVNQGKKDRVRLTDLLSRMNEEKKKERKSNIALSVVAISLVAVFGIILSL